MICGLWDWALAAYARPGAQAQCLALQDQEEQSVPYLLWAAWMGAQGRSPSSPVLARGAALAADWEQGVIGPLRGVRRRLKAEAAEGLRASVKTAELDAERELMGRLEHLAPAPSGPPQAAAVLIAAGAAWTPPAHPAGLQNLSALLE